MTGSSGPTDGPATDGRWHYRRSLASRVILLTTVTVGMAVTLVAVGAYFTIRVQMQDSLDDSLRERAHSAAKASSLSGVQIPQWWLGASDVRVAVVTEDRRAQILDRGPTMDLGEDELAVARGQQPSSVRTLVIAGERHRVAAVPMEQDGIAMVLAEPLEDQDKILARLGWVTLAFGVVGVLIAALAGWMVASNGLRPVRRLTSVVEEIARTEDLTPLPVEGDDEVARLATAFNQMLTSLDASRTRQRELVADASHELRTPLTSLRTNIDLLAMSSGDDDRLPPEARAELMDDIRAQAEELTALIGDLTELARDEPVAPQVEPVELGHVVDHAVERVRRRAPDVEFEAFTRPWWVEGEAWALERAVTNLLDNAAKWSPPGGRVTVRLSDGVLTIDDQGPGIPETDRSKIFDRFWRSDDSRTLPGSGLGLAIVRQVALRHSGTVAATENSSGGARLVMRLPGRETGGEEADA